MNLNFLDTFNSLLIQKRGYEFKIPQQNEHVILLVSGGVDSICLWNLLLDKYKLNVYPLFVNFTSKGVNPLKSVRYFEKFFEKRYPKHFRKVKILDNIPMFSFDKLPNFDHTMKDLFLISNNMQYLEEQNSYASLMVNNPSRLGHYAFYAFDYLLDIRYRIGVPIDTILCGIVEEDHYIRESTLATLRNVTLLLSEIIGIPNLQFSAPIEKKNNFFYSKVDLMKFAQRKNLSLEKTWSCHFKKSHHCGVCIECHTRKEGFYKAKIQDKTTYSKKTAFHGLKEKILAMYPSSKKQIDSPQIHINKNNRIYIPNDTIYINNKGFYHLLNKSHEYTVLNKSAGIIWRELSTGPKNLSQLKKLITTEYEVNPKEADRDIKILIEYLLTHKFLSLGS